MRVILRGIGFLFKLLFTLLVIGGITAGLIGYRFYRYFEDDLMTSDEAIVDLASSPVSLSSTIYYLDKDTGEYKEWVTLENAENRIWIHGDQIPDLFKKAFVAIEDERFWTHNGVDWKRTLHAAVNIFTGEKVFGGSTITQQLIKNITNDKEVTVHRKIIEIARALTMEQRYDKSLILEWYMNIVYFGHGQYGVGTAAEYYFGKDVSDLSLNEMCCIAAITNNPSLYNPYAYPENNRNRRNTILDKMVELGYISQFAAEAAKSEDLQLVQEHKRGTSMAEVYPYYVDAVIEDVIQYFQETKGITREHASTLLYHGGYRIYACVDMDIQKKMDAFYQDAANIPATRDGKALQSSMTIIDPYTGDIVGMEGGVGTKQVARGLNWASDYLGRRPPGSSVKPISTYGPAIENGLITPNTNFLDAEGMKLDGTDWFPNNDGGGHYGVVTIRTALRKSLNTIAAQVMDELSPAVSYQFLTEKLHMALEPADEDYAPLAAGQFTIGTTTREMASSYTIFPTMGQYTQGRTFSHIYDHGWELVAENTPVTNPAISAKTAYWITDMLQEAVRYGTGTDAKLSNMPAAGKTGTSESKKDRWFAGYTPYYVGVVWTGYEKPASISVSGNPAAKIWKAVMESIHEGLEYKDFTVPEDTYLAPVTGYTEPDTPDDSTWPWGPDWSGDDGWPDEPDDGWTDDDWDDDWDDESDGWDDDWEDEPIDPWGGSGWGWGWGTPGWDDTSGDDTSGDDTSEDNTDEGWYDDETIPPWLM